MMCVYCENEYTQASERLWFPCFWGPSKSPLVGQKFKIMFGVMNDSGYFEYF